MFGSPESLEDRKWRHACLYLYTRPTLRQFSLMKPVAQEMCEDGREPCQRAYKRQGDLQSFLPSDVPFAALSKSYSFTQYT